MSELVAYYDEHRNYVGYGEHQAGQEKGHYTENVFAFLVYVDPETGDGGLLLSVRADQKTHYAGLIEESAGGTVRFNPDTMRSETGEEAGEREIAEEIGVRLLGRLALITLHTHKFEGAGFGGFRRHHTYLLFGATDTPPHKAKLDPAEIKALMLIKSEVDLAALDREQCIPSLDEEFGQLLDFLRPHAGDQDAIQWAVANWHRLLEVAGSA